MAMIGQTKIRENRARHEDNVEPLLEQLCPFRDIGNRTFRRHGLHFSARRGRREDAMEGAFCYPCLRNGQKRIGRP